MTQREPQKTLASKLVAAMSLIDAVEKKGRNTQQGYSFVRAADVANEVRTAMVKAGVAFTYDVEAQERWDTVTSKGSTMFWCSLTVKATFTDSESGEQIAGRTVGWGSDMGDKAPYKAMTGALKYILRMNFLIPDESDPENAESEESHGPIQQQAPQPATSSYISEAQGKRLYAITKTKGITPDAVRNYLGSLGIENSREIPKGKYEQICKWAEAQ